MAKYTNEELIEAFKEMTLIELSEFTKLFEERPSTLPLLLRLLLLPLALQVARLLLRKRRPSSTSCSRTWAPRRSA